MNNNLKMEITLRRAINSYVEHSKVTLELMDDSASREFFKRDYEDALNLQKLLDNAIIVSDQGILYMGDGIINSERLFDKLDEELHDTTWRVLDEKVDRLQNRVDELEEEVELYEAV